MPALSREAELALFRALQEALSNVLRHADAGIGAAAYLFVIVIALNLGLMSKLTPTQIETSRTLLLIIGANVAARFAFGWYGGVIVGFQRYHLNNLTSIVTSLAVAATNVIVLLSGYGIVALVAATTVVRILALLVYRSNAYRTFPGLSINWASFKRERLGRDCRRAEQGSRRGRVVEACPRQ
jgi:glucose-6-phosphate-specific signal transduction histidine kinase